MAGRDDEAAPEEPDDGSSGLATLGSVLLVGIVAVAAYYGLQFMGPDEVKLGKDPGFVDLIFSDRWVIGAARLLFLFIGAYVMYSVVVLVRDGRPISAAGVVKADPAEEALEAGQELLLEGRDLKLELTEAQEDRDFLLEHATQLQDEVDRLQARLTMGDDPADG